jgi:hypothetical protein
MCFDIRHWHVKPLNRQSLLYFRNNPASISHYRVIPMVFFHGNSMNYKMIDQRKSLAFGNQFNKI